VCRCETRHFILCFTDTFTGVELARKHRPTHETPCRVGKLTRSAVNFSHDCSAVRSPRRRRTPQVDTALQSYFTLGKSVIFVSNCGVLQLSLQLVHLILQGKCETHNFVDINMSVCLRKC